MAPSPGGSLRLRLARQPSPSSLPQKSRGGYKKTLLGDGVYREQLAGQKQD